MNEKQNTAQPTKSEKNIGLFKVSGMSPVIGLGVFFLNGVHIIWKIINV